MSEPRHTPGPWRAEMVGSPMIYGMVPKTHPDEGRHGTEFRLADVRGWGCLQYLPSGEGERMQDANARLIAAAPEMYAALREVSRSRDVKALGQVLAALEKAEGRA